MIDSLGRNSPIAVSHGIQSKAPRNELFDTSRVMAEKGDDFLAKSFAYFQETVRRAGPAASASYTLVGAILVLGGIGYLIDASFGTAPWFLLGGLLLGIVVGFYELAKAVFKG